MQCLEGYENNCNVSKDKATILIFGRKRLEFQCLKEGPNSSVWKDRARFPMFGKIGPNSSVWKDRAKIPIFCFDYVRIKMFG